MTISVSFTVVSVCCLCFLGVMLYTQFERQQEDLTVETSGELLEQTSINIEDYLRSMRRTSDAMYYSVIKDKDLAVDNLYEEMNLLYEANKDKLVSIACYTGDGSLVAAIPVDTPKQSVDVTAQEWFQDALETPENFHFSSPHVQNLFDDSSYRYDWVISLSRTVELTYNGTTELGVLLIDMNYSSIEQLFEKVNSDSSEEYFYLMEPDGSIIYHPKQDLIHSGLYSENNLEAASSEEESWTETFEGQRRIVSQRTISYIGWKIVSVVPASTFSILQGGSLYVVLLLIGLSLLAIVLLNQFVSRRVSMPLRKLNDSVEEWEAGNLHPDIYVGGSSEVEHLGMTLRSTVNQIQELMDDIVVEQEEKRKSELDALQAQINPHFLYNTLDSIMWMITGGRYDEAVFMVSELASLLRISLSKGSSIIKVEDEIRHAESYTNIQKIRYKNSFQVQFDIDPGIEQCCTVKLIVQPLIENAIYYGMESMDGDGLITVRGYRRGDDVYLEVQDNGLGMPEEEAAKLLTDNEHVTKQGSGVGLMNVHERIQLRFGEQYGLIIETHPDEGMTVRIHIPYIPFTEENRKMLDEGKRPEMFLSSGKETEDE